jgi:copper(I)-binding protein
MISRRTLGVTIIAVLPLVAACGAGQDTTTDKERQTPYVASATAGSLFLTAAVLVPSQATTSGTSADGSATATPSASESGSASPTAAASSSSDSASGSGSAEAYLVLTVVNRGGQPDQLTGAQVQGASVTPSDASAGGLTVQPQQSLRFVDPEFGSTGPALAVSGFSQPIERGTAVSVTFQFENAGSATILVPVRGADELGTTATSTPVPLTHSYPSASAPPEVAPSGG